MERSRVIEGALAAIVAAAILAAVGVAWRTATAAESRDRDASSQSESAGKTQPTSNEGAGAGSSSSSSSSATTTTTTATPATTRPITPTTVPPAASLSSLPVVDGTSYENEPPAVMDGIEYADAVRMGRSVFGDVRLEFNVEGRYRRLTGIVGFTDDAYDWRLHNGTESWSMHWEVRMVSIDNGVERILFTARLQNGQTAPFDVDLSGVRRLELVVEESDAARTSGSLEDMVVVWGNPRLVA